MVLIAGWIPSVMGSDYMRGDLKVELEPSASWNYNETVNLAEEEALPLERDFLHSTMFEYEGIYYGPYLRSSIFEFDHQGGTFKTISTFRFKHEDIINGVSDLWIRIPVVPYDYHGWYFWLGDEGITIDQMQWSCTLWGTYDECTSWTSEDPFVIMDSTGIYVRFWTGIFPERDYTFVFEGYLFPDSAPKVHVSIEKLQEEQETFLEFYEWSGREVGEKDYDIVHRLELYPAWAFVFISGMGQSGLTSYSIPVDNDSAFTRYFYWEYDVTTESSYDLHYISLYIPFDSGDPVDWHINMSFIDVNGYADQYWQFENPLVPSEKASYLDFWVYDQEHFLLLSSPWRLDYLGTPDDHILYISAQACNEVILLGYVQPSFSEIGEEWRFYRMFTNASFEWWQYIDRGIPLFIVTEITDGQWAEVTYYEHYRRFDFGWGRGYLYRGESVLIMFLQDGTSIFGDPTVTGEVTCPIPAITEIPKWIDYLWCMISHATGDLVGFLSSIFDRIWSFIVGYGEWLYSVVVSVIDWIVSMAMNVIDVVGTILQSSLMILPILITLFVLAKGGRYVHNLGAEKSDREVIRESLREKIGSGVKKVRERRTRIRKRFGRGS